MEGSETETERDPEAETGIETEIERGTETEIQTGTGTEIETGQTETVTVTAAATAPERTAAAAAAVGGPVRIACLQGMATQQCSRWRPPARLGLALDQWVLALVLGVLCGVQLEDQWGP